MDTLNMIDDPFRISYSTGFALFLSVTVIVGIVLVGVVCCESLIQIGLDFERRDERLEDGHEPTLEDTMEAYERPERDSSYFQWEWPICTTILLVSTACLAWLTARLPYETTYEEPPYNSVTGIFVGSIAMIIMLANFFYRLRCRSGGLTPNPLTTCYIMATSFLLVPGLVLLTMYCSQMKSVQAYEYYPMKITGYAYKAMGSTSVKCTRYYGKAHVEWGMDWGCPEYSNDTWCQSYINLKDCEHCEGNEKSTLECVREKYHLPDWEENDFPGFNEEDKKIPPTEDENWQYDYFYGDCSSCKAMDAQMLEGKVDYAMKLKPIGTGMAIAGVAIYFGLFSVWAIRTFRTRSIRVAVLQNNNRT